MYAVNNNSYYNFHEFYLIHRTLSMLEVQVVALKLKSELDRT